MVTTAVADFGVLDYSITAAAAVLDTLALLSSTEDALGSESQVTHDSQLRIPQLHTKTIQHSPMNLVGHCSRPW